MINTIGTIVIACAGIYSLYNGFTYDESKIKNEIKDKERFINVKRKFGKIFGVTGIMLAIICFINGYKEELLGVDVGIIFCIANIMLLIELCFYSSNTNRLE